MHIKVGDIVHPMQAQHYINNIDVYLDNAFVARTELRPDKINPAAAVHLKVDKGTITAIERCNVHGAWINTAEV